MIKLYKTKINSIEQAKELKKKLESVGCKFINNHVTSYDNYLVNNFCGKGVFEFLYCGNNGVYRKELSNEEFLNKFGYHELPNKLIGTRCKTEEDGEFIVDKIKKKFPDLEIIKISGFSKFYNIISWIYDDNVIKYYYEYFSQFEKEKYLSNKEFLQEFGIEVDRMPSEQLRVLCLKANSPYLQFNQVYDAVDKGTKYGIKISGRTRWYDKSNFTKEQDGLCDPRPSVGVYTRMFLNNDLNEKEQTIKEILQEINDNLKAIKDKL